MDKPAIGMTITIEIAREREIGRVVEPIKTDPPSWTRIELPTGEHRLACPEEIVATQGA